MSERNPQPDRLQAAVTVSEMSLQDRLNAVRSQLFFIVGCARSGTTLLQASLLAHPEVTIPPETKFYDTYPARAWRIGNPALPRQFSRCAEFVWRDQKRREVETDHDRFLQFAEAAPGNWDGLFIALLAAYAEARDALRIGEKSPVHSYHMEHLHRAFPEARFVHLVRDPRAVVLSLMKAGFGTRFIGPHIAQWHDAIEMHRRYHESLEPRRYMLLKYEDLVTDMEQSIQQVCDFLGVSFHSCMLEPHKRSEKGFPRSASDWMENTLKPVFTSGIDRWRHELRPAHVAVIEHVLRSDMELMGYEPSGATTFAPATRTSLSHLAGNIHRGTRRIIHWLRRAAARRWG